MTSPDPTLSARRAEPDRGLKALIDRANSSAGDNQFAMDAYRKLLQRAFEDRQLITLADAEAMVRAAENRGLLKAVEIINANVSPCVPPTGWTDEELEGYSNGQMDAAASFMDAIRTRVKPHNNEVA